MEELTLAAEHGPFGMTGLGIGGVSGRGNMARGATGQAGSL
jgi:hypothetical protein